jgi:hypothetical protein
MDHQVRQHLDEFVEFSPFVAAAGVGALAVPMSRDSFSGEMEV